MGDRAKGGTIEVTVEVTTEVTAVSPTPPPPPGVQGRGDDAEDGGGSTALCRSLQAYAAACQAAGGELQEWREAAKCRELECLHFARVA